MWFGAFLRCVYVKRLRFVSLPTTMNVLVVWGILLGAPPDRAAAQQPVIRHTALECLTNDQFPELAAFVQPGAEVRTCKVYFRSDKYPDFYYVEMEADAADRSRFLAVLPMPSLETREVVYYIEVVDRDFNGVRTEEFAPQVASGSECRRRDPAAAWFTGSNPSIVVGATRFGMSSIPPGFQAAGIAGFVSAAGVASGVGGGVGAGTVAAVGAGAAAAAGAAVALSGEDSATTTTSLSASAAPGTAANSGGSATTTTIAAVQNEPPKACFQSDPYPPSIKEGEAIRLDASCSRANESEGGTDTIARYEWDLGDGRTREGRVITPVYRTAGRYTVTLTVTDSGGGTLRSGWGQSTDAKSDQASMEITVEPAVEPVRACFTAISLGMCAVTFDASCSTGPISRYEWLLDVNDVLKKWSEVGPVVTHDWYNYGCSALPTPIRVRLTVFGDSGQTDTLEQTVDVKYSRGNVYQEADSEASFTSHLDVGGSPEVGRGQVLLNGSRLDVTPGSVPFRHRFRGRVGENTVVAYTTPGAAEGLWRFDFTGADNFVGGSISVKLGQVVSLDAHSVVFRLSGAGERVEFCYRLARGRH